ncbi:down syndrome cell adhesion molecule [Caerostris extrusa]|uniref:Down syndrome cell adhesion molecule n=1 Tax=Caerostris extrusa TaxID=172846 RepID=A0AAV4XZT3_CAEEX|nr:down syndrome cell adhesion molecule [Caerostris extrusa]
MLHFFAVPARFENKFQVETVRWGETAILHCEAFGDKPITLTWTKNQMPISEKESTRYEVYDSQSGRAPPPSCTCRKKKIHSSSFSFLRMDSRKMEFLRVLVFRRPQRHLLGVRASPTDAATLQPH